MSDFVDKNNISPIPSNEKYFDLKKDLTLNKNRLDKHTHHVCIKLSTDLIERNKEDGSLNFFRESTTTMAIWLFIIKSYSIKNTINESKVDAINKCFKFFLASNIRKLKSSISKVLSNSDVLISIFTTYQLIYK